MSDNGSNHFHLTLPSNSSMDIFPNNTTAQYVTKLLKHIELNGDWRVSLKEISIPRTLVNIGRGTHSMKIKNIETGRVVNLISLPGNMYASIQLVVNELNKLTRQGIILCYAIF